MYGRLLGTIPAFVCIRADVLFDVIFLPLFAVFRLEIKDTTVGTALYYRRCLLLRSRLQHTVAKKHCGMVGWIEKLNHAIGILIGRFG